MSCLTVAAAITLGIGASESFDWLMWKIRHRPSKQCEEALAILRRFEKSDVTAIGFDLKRVFTRKVLEKIRQTEPDYAELTFEQVIFMDQCLTQLNRAKNKFGELATAYDLHCFDASMTEMFKALQGTGYCLSDLGTSQKELARLRNRCEEQIFQAKIRSLQLLRNQYLGEGISMLDYLKSRNKSIYDCPPDVAAFLETCG